MKILVIQDDFPPQSFGGAGTVAHNLSREFVNRGHEVHVVTATEDSKNVGIEDSGGLRIYRIEAHYSNNFQAYTCLWNPAAVREIKKILNELKPDVVHAHGVHGYLSYASLVAAKRSGSRVVLTCHDVQSFNYGKLIDFIDPKDLSVPKSFDYRISPFLQMRQRTWRYNPFRNAIIRWIFRHYVDTIVAVSDELRKALEVNGISPVSVVHNGIDAAVWEPNEKHNQAFKERFRLGEHAILFGGRISPVKGSDKLLEALMDIRKRVPDAQLLVASQKDEFFNRLVRRAEKLGMADAIIGTDWISGDDLKAAYYSSAVVAVPTLSFDSFPTMNLEAFACKKPVVATCFGGSRELVQDGISGYIVNPYNVSMLAEKISALLNDAPMRVAMGVEGYERVSKEFRIQDQAHAYEQIFRI